MIEFATKHNMIITNSLFEKRAKAKWTWKSPGGDCRNEIDYILTNKRHIFRNCAVLNKPLIGSGHRMIRCDLEIKAEKKTTIMIMKRSKADMEKLAKVKDAFQIELKNRFALLQEDEEINLDELNDQVANIIKESTEKVANRNNTSHKFTMTDEIKDLIKKRSKIKSKLQGHQITEYIELCKVIRKRIREEKKEI